MENGKLTLSSSRSAGRCILLLAVDLDSEVAFAKVTRFTKRPQVLEHSTPTLRIRVDVVNV
jgi:hypothetical protein